MEDRRLPIRPTGFTHSVDVTSGAATGKLASIVLRERFEPGEAAPPQPRWCRACGAVPRAGGQQDDCGPCGTPLDPPEQRRADHAALQPPLAREAADGAAHEALLRVGDGLEAGGSGKLRDGLIPP